MQLLDSETPDNYEFQIPAPNLYKNTFRLHPTVSIMGWGKLTDINSNNWNNTIWPNYLIICMKASTKSPF